MKSRKYRLAVLGLIIGLLMPGCGDQRAYNEQEVFSINKESVYLDEMLYHVLIAEFQGKVVSSYFGDLKGYWNSEYEPEVSMSEEKHQEILDNVIKYEIYYQKALEDGLKLNEEEKKEASQTVTSMKNNMGEEAIAKTGLSDEQLQHITEKVLLATKYYCKQAELLEIDEESITSGINKEDYEVYKLQYVFIPKNIKDKQGVISRLNQDEINEAIEHMKEYRKELEKISTLDELEVEKDEFNPSKGEIEFTIKNQPFREETNIVEESQKLNLGDTSQVFETIKGYYVIKRVESKDRNTYEKAIEETVKEKKEALLDEGYLKLKEDFNIKVNKSVWEKIQIGKMIITE